MVQSPNFDDRKEDSVIDMLIMHYTGMQSAEEAIDRLCDPACEVSAHYVVEEDGNIIQLVDEYKRAWHAGASHWRGHEGINHRSIGVEIVNPGHEFGYCAFPDEQMESVIELSKGILTRHSIEPRNVIGHSDIAPDRKEDPGELFDWQLLATHHIGLWPDVKVDDIKTIYHQGETSEDITRLQQKLVIYGYKLNCTGIYDEDTQHVCTAFKRHFSPETLKMSGWDSLAQARLDTLLALVA